MRRPAGASAETARQVSSEREFCKMSATVDNVLIRASEIRSSRPRNAIGSDAGDGRCRGARTIARPTAARRKDGRPRWETRR